MQRRSPIRASCWSELFSTRRDGRGPASPVRIRSGSTPMSGHPQDSSRAATISVLVDNEAGILARVIGLFTGRGYHIDSLTVAPVDAAGAMSRINVVTSGTAMVITQIKAQL